MDGKVAERLRGWLRLHGYKTVDVAEWLGVKRDTAAAHLSEDARLTVEDLEVIAKKVRLTRRQLNIIFGFGRSEEDE